MDGKKQRVVCQLCDQSFSANKSLYRHQRRIHNLKVIISGKNKCEKCSLSFLKHLDLVQHIKVEHNGGDEEDPEELHFPSVDEFRAWKAEEEKASVAKFSVATGTYNTAAGSRNIFLCHRYGEYKSKGLGLRHLKSQGSCRAGFVCTSRIESYVHEDGMVSVLYYSKHRGHSTSIGHLQLTEEERTMIAGQLRCGVSFSHILNSIRDKFEVSDNITRLHLLSNKDLHNIADSIGCNKEAQAHSDDATSVDMWVKQCQESIKDGEYNPVLFYKPQGVESNYGEIDGVAKNDFILCIQTAAQLDALKKFGSSNICIDDTHNAPGYNFHLTTVMTVDDFGEGVPVAFCISNRVNTNIMSVFFTAIKFRAGPINTKCFMSDDTNVFINAWSAVFNSPTETLLCVWHVDKNWREALDRLVTGPEKKASIYKIIRTLLEELDEANFYDYLQLFLNSNDSDEGTQKFIKYFKNHYANRPHKWAYCFRKGTMLNTNMRLEVMHRLLKHLYLAGKTNKRMDRCIRALISLTRDCVVFGRAIKEFKGKVTSTIRRIRDRHVESKKMLTDSVSQISDTMWQVTSQSVQHKNYQVEKILSPCFHNTSLKCRMVCSDCKICVHSYQCSCLDYAVHGTICKHIHAAVGFSQRSKQEKVNSINASEDIPSESFINFDIKGHIAEHQTLTQTQSVKNPFNKVEYFVGIIKSCNMEMLEECPELKSEFNNILDKAITEGKKFLSKCNKPDIDITSQDTVKAGRVKKIEPQRRLFSTKKSKNSSDYNRHVKKCKPTDAEKTMHMDLLRNQHKEVLNIHTGYDHTYHT